MHMCYIMGDMNIMKFFVLKSQFLLGEESCRMTCEPYLIV
jgi:hypothetical protein